MGENIIAIREKSTEQANLAFRHFMRLVEHEINARAKADKRTYSSCSAFELEKLSEQILKDVAPQTTFRPQNIQLVSGAKFPDIVAEKYYGVEVKSTEKDHWTSTGSSIVETTRLSDVESIYLLFGKLGGAVPEFKCRPYQDCMYEIAVTHSPRYLINMELASGQSIFDKMGTTYNRLRTSADSIQQVRNYYRKKANSEHRTEMPWWLDSPTKMTVRLWNDGTIESRTENAELTAKMFILFPEVFRSDYKRAAMWLCTKYSILLHNARDTFSAGGQYNAINGHKLKFKLPHIVGELLAQSAKIKYYLNNPKLIQAEIIEYYPELLNDGDRNVYRTWLSLTDRVMQNLTISTEHKTIRQLGGIPFCEWFEAEQTLQIL